VSELLREDSASVRQVAHELKRLGKNINGYRGETIPIASVLSDCVASARKHGWRLEEFCPAPKLMLAFKRVEARPAPALERPLRIYLSTGIHGDEPAGPLAVRQLLAQNQWPEQVDLWLCPCLNADGFVHNRRENDQGLDLNREYLHPKAPEIAAHIEWLNRQPAFDLSMCLHEDWESHGFYVYELNPQKQPSLAEPIVKGVGKVCPIDCSEIIEGRPACSGIIRPELDPLQRPQWPEAFYLLRHKTSLSYTLEAPSDYPLPVRVAALMAGVQAALEAFIAFRAGA
jgi:murein peptide amidase A